MHWETVLKKLFSAHWQDTGSDKERLTAFFEDPAVCKLVAHALAGMVVFLREERDKVRYLFEVVNALSENDLNLFESMAANGLNTVLNKNKRLACPEQQQGQAYPIRIEVISREQIAGIVDNIVEKYLDTAIDWCLQYQLSVAQNNPRRKLAKQFSNSISSMNHDLWQELLALVSTQKRVLYRNRYLLRIVIHYLFETRDVDRDYWKKYIPSVDRIITHAFSEDKGRLAQFESVLDERIALCRQAEKYHGTDWDSFYQDPKVSETAKQVIYGIREKAASRLDKSIPEVWFSNQVGHGVDDQVLYRFFKQCEITI